MSKVTKQAKKVTEAKKEPSVITFLLPCFKTPLLTSDLLYTVLETKMFDGCAFVLLLEADDPSLDVYKELVDNVRDKGLECGYFVFDGTPYCGKVNRIASILNSLSVCVLDNKHFPISTNIITMKEAVETWLKTRVEPMGVGVFNEVGDYPVVTRSLIDRLGYMFHPLCFGREEAERWLLSIGNELGVLGLIDGFDMVEAQAQVLDIQGFSTDEDVAWVSKTLEQLLDEEVMRLSEHLVK